MDFVPALTCRAKIGGVEADLYCGISTQNAGFATPGAKDLAGDRRAHVGGHAAVIDLPSAFAALQQKGQNERTIAPHEPTRKSGIFLPGFLPQLLPGPKTAQNCYQFIAISGI
jgi:hypothetical protein